MTIGRPRIEYLRADRPQSLTEFLTSRDVTSERIEHLLNYGAIYVNGLRQRTDGALAPGDTLRVHHEPKPFLSPGFSWTPEIVFEDEDLIAIDKPGGLATHPTLDNFQDNIKTLSEHHLHRTLYVTHRLDIPTSGVLLMAKTPAAQSGLNKLFRKRRIQKIYRTITENSVPEGFYLHYMNPESKTPKAVSDSPIEGWVDARMRIRHLDQSGKILEIELETGRTHQIRAQLAKLGAPILGDLEYGSKNTLSQETRFVQGRIALECFELAFTFRSLALRISRPVSLVTPHMNPD